MCYCRCTDVMDRCGSQRTTFGISSLIPPWLQEPPSFGRTAWAASVRAGSSHWLYLLLCFYMSLCVVCVCMCMCTYACMHAEGQGRSQSLPLSLWTLFAETEQLSWTQHWGTGVFYPTSRIHTEIPRFTNGKRPVSRSHRKVGSVPGLANSGCILEFTTAQHPKYNETWCPTIEEWVKKTDTGIFSTIRKDEGLWSAEKEI